MLHLEKRLPGGPSKDLQKLALVLGLSAETLEMIEPNDVSIRDVAIDALIRVADRRLAEFLSGERSDAGRYWRWEERRRQKAAGAAAQIEGS
jgi:hypothetical protein